MFAWTQQTAKRKPPANRGALPDKRQRRCLSTTQGSGAGINVECDEDDARGEASPPVADDGPDTAPVLARTHVCCECVETLTQKAEIAESESCMLQAECAELRYANVRLQVAENFLSCHVFSINHIKTDNKLIAFYTGSHHN